MKHVDGKWLVHLGALTAVFMILAVGLFGLRDFGAPTDTDMDDHFIAHGQEETGANNIVTSIVFDYRGFDTLGEASVLFAAVLGIGVLLDWGKGKVRSAKNTKSAKQRSSKTIPKSVAKPARKKKSDPEPGKTKSEPILKK